jgi:hypothetical protein
MAEEKKEPWLNWLALTTVILAVCATMATFKGGGYSTKSILNQSKSSDQFAFYQAKSIKGYQYEMAKEKLELELKLLGTKAPKDVAAEYDKTIREYGKKVEKYEGEKAAIMNAARGFETLRDDAQKHGAPFGFAVIFLQISILLSSIAALLKKQPVWWLGLAVGAVGLVFFANGFFLFMP